MAIDQKEAESKEFLNRADIVTMKKDIKRLREADAFKESAKITTAPIASQSPKAPEILSSLDPKPKFEPRKDFVKKVPVASVEKKGVTPIPKVSGDKTNATEDEKQKIFLLESQRAETEKQIQLINGKTPALDLEKTGIQKEREDWQKKLNPLIEKAETGSEEQKQAIEKERWPIETELEKAENRGKDIDAKYRELETSKSQLNQKITQIDNSLKEMYLGIEKRTKEIEKAKQASLQQPITPPTTPKVEKQTTAPVTKEPEKPYLKNVPLVAKEQLSQSANSEEEQRRKFLEDIDTWASFNTNQREQKQ